MCDIITEWNVFDIKFSKSSLLSVNKVNYIINAKINKIMLNNN